MEDQDYIVAVEKAISEKYGEDTSRDVRYFWDNEKEAEYKKALWINELRNKKTTPQHRV